MYHMQVHLPVAHKLDTPSGLVEHGGINVELLSFAACVYGPGSVADFGSKICRYVPAMLLHHATRQGQPEAQAGPTPAETGVPAVRHQQWVVVAMEDGPGAGTTGGTEHLEWGSSSLC